MTLKELAVKHSYYASPTNYYSLEARGIYKTWGDFYREFCDADVDLNLVFRWDIDFLPDDDIYYMQIIIIHQQKGIYMPIQIQLIEDKDVPAIVEFLKIHYEKINKIWEPIS